MAARRFGELNNTCVPVLSLCLYFRSVFEHVLYE